MILKKGETFLVGVLAADNVFVAVRGIVSWSTNGGTTKDNIYGPEHDPLNDRGRVVISSGLNVTLYNDRRKDCEVVWQPI